MTREQFDALRAMIEAQVIHGAPPASQVDPDFCYWTVVEEARAALVVADRLCDEADMGVIAVGNRNLADGLDPPRVDVLAVLREAESALKHYGTRDAGMLWNISAAIKQMEGKA